MFALFATPAAYRWLIIIATYGDDDSGECDGERRSADTLSGLRRLGHELASDEPERRGGTNTGAAPFDLMLASLGACTAITLRMYSDRKQWKLGTIDVKLRLSKKATTPMRIERKISVSEAIDGRAAGEAARDSRQDAGHQSAGARRADSDGIRDFDPAGALKLRRLEREPHHRVFDAMPVVHPGALDDAVILFLADFPAALVASSTTNSLMCS